MKLDVGGDKEKVRSGTVDMLIATVCTAPHLYSFRHLSYS
jgi:hypothetical protein